jgi:hypothetical protein
MGGEEGRESGRKRTGGNRGKEGSEKQTFLPTAYVEYSRRLPEQFGNGKGVGDSPIIPMQIPFPTLNSSRIYMLLLFDQA